MVGLAAMSGDGFGGGAIAAGVGGLYPSDEWGLGQAVEYLVVGELAPKIGVEVLAMAVV
jgi:hypothetical protein